MKEIAIIKVYDNYDDNYLNKETLIESITNWDEISDGDFNLIRKHLNKMNDHSYEAKFSYLVLERVKEVSVVSKLVDDFKIRAQKFEEEEIARKEAAKKRAETLKAKKAEKIIKAYESLKSEQMDDEYS